MERFRHSGRSWGPAAATLLLPFRSSSVSPARSSRRDSCLTPGAAAQLSTRSWLLWCLQLLGLQLPPRGSVGPDRLRCPACALVANRRSPWA